MNIMVAVKHAIDYEVDVSINEDGTNVETEHVSFAMNPFDEVALEAAVQLKESGFATHVFAVCIGGDDAMSSLRSAIASGADDALLVKSQVTDSPLIIAKILREIAIENHVTSVFLGKQSLDKENMQTAAMLSTFMSLPLIANVSHIETHDSSLAVTQVTENGSLTYAVNAPCVISCNLNLCQPRFASLKDIMRAKKTNIKQLLLSDLSVKPDTQIHTNSVRTPTARTSCQMLEDVTKFAELIREKRV